MTDSVFSAPIFPPSVARYCQARWNDAAGIVLLSALRSRERAVMLQAGLGPQVQAEFSERSWVRSFAAGALVLRFLKVAMPLTQALHTLLPEARAMRDEIELRLA